MHKWRTSSAQAVVGKDSALCSLLTTQPQLLAGGILLTLTVHVTSKPRTISRPPPFRGFRSIPDSR